MAKERKCLSCGKEYSYCPNCGKASEAWKFNFDTEACRELFNTVSAFNMGLVDEQKVKDVLIQYNITDYSQYRGNISDTLNKISNKRINKVQEVVTEEVNNFDTIENFSNIVEEEKPVEVVPEVDGIDQPYITEPVRSRRRGRIFE